MTLLSIIHRITNNRFKDWQIMSVLAAILIIGITKMFFFGISSSDPEVQVLVEMSKQYIQKNETFVRRHGSYSNFKIMGYSIGKELGIKRSSIPNEARVKLKASNGSQSRTFKLLFKKQGNLWVIYDYK